MATRDQQLVSGNSVHARERWRQLCEPAGAGAVGGECRQRDPAAGVRCWLFPGIGGEYVFCNTQPRGHAQKKSITRWWRAVPAMALRPLLQAYKFIVHDEDDEHGEDEGTNYSEGYA